MTIEDDVRTALRGAADDLGDPVVPHRLLAAGLRDAGRRRTRRRVGFGAAGLAVAVVVAAVPVGIATLRNDRPSIAAPAAATADVLGVPTRGSLAQDRAFLDELVQLDWTSSGEVSDPPTPIASVDTRRVVFAGDVPGGRWALVVGENPDPSTLPTEQQTDLGALSDVAGLWFVGPEGAAPDQMVPVTHPRGLTADQVQSLSDPSTGTVVVLAAPGDVLALSDRPVIAADASVTREWRRVGDEDGVAVDRLPVSVSTYGRAGQYRVTRDGVQVQQQSPDMFARPDGFSEPTIPVQYLRGQVPTADLLDQSNAADVLGATGLGIEDVRFQVLWSGGVPGPDGGPAYATVMVATLPSGALVVIGSDVQIITPAEGMTGASYGGGMGARQLLPAGTAVADLVVALRSQVSGDDGRGTVTSLVVTVPDGSTTVTAVDDDGAALGSFPVVGGAAVAPFPEGTTSVVVDLADGSRRTVALSTYTGDF